MFPMSGQRVEQYFPYRAVRPNRSLDGVDQTHELAHRRWLTRLPLALLAMVLVASSLTSGAAAQAPSLRINEFVASNSVGLADATGDRTDWIELINASSTTVDLTGWRLVAGTDVHTFVGGSIAPGAYLVLRASGDPLRTTPQELHVDFKLSASGEALWLEDPSGAVSDPAWPTSYPTQSSDISYGLAPDGSLAYFATPTPGAANATGTNGVVAPIGFSVAHGFFDSPFELGISSATPGANVRYTLDGSAPSETNGTVLAAGQTITVASTSTVRAIAYASGAISSPVATQTYLFTADIATQPESVPSGWPVGPVQPQDQVMVYGMDPDLVTGNEQRIEDSLKALPTLSIVSDLDQLFDPVDGVLALPESRGIENPISFELIDPQGIEPGFTIDAGVRVRGTSTRAPSLPRHNLGLFFRDEYGGRLEYPLFGDSGTSSFEKLDLRMGGGWDWSRTSRLGDQSTMLRELWFRDTQADVGQPHTRTNYFHLYINGQYWGVYLSQERVGDYFGESYFGGDEANYDALKITKEPPSIDPLHKSYEAADGNGDAWELLHPYVIDEVVDDADFAFIESQVDLINLADYYAIHMWGGFFDGSPDPNTGGRSNNWFGLRDRTGVGPMGKWHFFHHDAEGSLCIDEMTEFDPTTPWDLTSGGFLDPVYLSPAWLHQPLLTHPTYRQIFIDRVALHTAPGGALDLAEATARFDARVAELDPAIEAQAARWGDGYGPDVTRTKTDWLNAVQGVRDCFAARAPLFQEQLEADGLWPTVATPSISPGSGDVAFATPVTVTTEASGTIWITTDGTDPRGADGQPSATAVAYTAGIAVTRPLTINVRSLDGTSWSPLASSSFAPSSPQGPLTIVLNEYNAVDGDRYLGGGSAGDVANGSDTFFGRVPGNGGDWFELVVLEDRLDLRGWTLQLRDGIDDSAASRESLVFADRVELAAVEAGTIITISEDLPDDLSFAPWNDDWHINLQANDDDDGAFFTPQSQENFATSNQNWQLTILNADGDLAFGAAGEGIGDLSGVNGTEIGELEVDPTTNVDRLVDYGDGKSSTFGAPNVTNEVPQDFSAIRLSYELGDVNCDGTVNTLDALFVAQFTAGSRSTVQRCSLSNSTSILSPAGDLDDDGITNSVDALLIMRCNVGSSTATVCPDE